MTASFAGVAGSAFTVAALNTGRSEIDFDAGIAYNIGKTASISVGYQGAFRDDVERPGVSAQLRFGF